MNLASNCYATSATNTGQRFYGKFRGKVLDNVDPEFRGRILAEVPAVMGSTLNWALPCTPYAGPNVGFYAIPPIGANVWIEFEGGDPNYPVWVGCFWGIGEAPLTPEPPVPELKIFKTEFITMVLSDLPELGGFLLECLVPAVDVPLTMKFDSEGVTILCPESVIKMTPESITLTVPEAVITIEAASITATVPEAAIEITPELISLEVAPGSIEISPAAIEIEAPDVSVTGVTEVTGETNIGPLLTVEGETNHAGAVTMEGALNVAGAAAFEGAVNIAGNLSVEGAGEIDGAPII